MFGGVVSTKNYCVRFSICTQNNEKDPKKSRLWIEVDVCNHVENTVSKNEYTAEEYGQAYEQYKNLCTEMEEKYGK